MLKNIINIFIKKPAIYNEIVQYFLMEVVI